MGKQLVLSVFFSTLLASSAWAGDLPTEAQMEDLLADITVFENELIPGQYESANFAEDFQAACAGFDVHCMQLFFGTPNGTSHAANVIEIDYPNSTIIRKFCMVEPQTNEVVSCWLDDEISDKLLPGVTWLDINTAYPWFPAELKESNDDYFFFVDSEFAN